MEYNGIELRYTQREDSIRGGIMLDAHLHAWRDSDGELYVRGRTEEMGGEGGVSALGIFTDIDGIRCLGRFYGRLADEIEEKML